MDTQQAIAQLERAGFPLIARVLAAQHTKSKLVAIDYDRELIRLAGLLADTRR